MAAITYQPPSISIRVPRRHIRRLAERILIALVLVLVVAVVSRTIVAIGAGVYKDRVAYDIIKHHSHTLKFTVAGHDYQVVTPNIPLTDFQREAYFDYAKRHGYPTYAADGPLAIDP